MSHTIYAAKFEQMIIHQHLHLRRESQSHAPARVLTRLYLIDKSLVSLQSERTFFLEVLTRNYNRKYVDILYIYGKNNMHGLLDIFINLQFLSHVIIFKTKVLLPQT